MMINIEIREGISDAIQHQLFAGALIFGAGVTFSVDDEIDEIGLEVYRYVDTRESEIFDARDLAAILTDQVDVPPG